MREIKRRRILSFAIDVAAMAALYAAGAGFWCMLSAVHGCWCFYDGITRLELWQRDAKRRGER